jgi:DNA polymerase III alpha subunit (gram-positive type)
MNFLKKFFNLEPVTQDLPIEKNTKVKNRVKTHSEISAGKKRTYKGPSFAQPGEISELFGYANFNLGRNIPGPYSIIDLETSHLSPNYGHIIEIAILQIDATGKKIGEFSTLVKPPDGQVGATDIHGIKKIDVKNAPLFSEIIGNIFSILNNSIIVAHNARFEEGFLKKELNRSGQTISAIPALDTLWLSRQVIDLENYKLKTVVSGYGHKIINAHTALGDTRAVAKILPKMLKQANELKYPVDLQKLPKNKIHKSLQKRK